jgi:hypothetical protein
VVYGKKEMKNSSEQAFGLAPARGDVEGVSLSEMICRTNLQGAAMLGPLVVTFGELKFCCVGHKFNRFSFVRVQTNQHLN